jgi:hypothetical protein
VSSSNGCADEDDTAHVWWRMALMQFRRGILAVTRMGGRERALVQERWTCQGKSPLCHVLTSSPWQASR